MHIAFLDQFSFIENIANMACDDGLVTLEQLRHLALREPHGVAFESHFEADGLIRLIYNDFVFTFLYDVFPCESVYYVSRSRISLAGSSSREKAKRDFPRSLSEAPIW